MDKLQSWDFYKLEGGIISNVKDIDWSVIQTAIVEDLHALANRLATEQLPETWTIANAKYFRIERTKLENNRSGKLRIKNLPKLLQLKNTQPQYTKFFSED